MGETGASSMRQLPTLTLFKINMNLEMEKGTEALAAAAEPSPPRELDRQPYDETDVAVICALQGPMAAVSAPTMRPPPRSESQRRSCWRGCRAWSTAKSLRSVAAILYHRRAGFSANGMGVWKVPEEQIMQTGARMASFRGISHCYQRPTYEDWPYSVFTMAHGRSKQECDAILDSIADDCEMGPDDRATLVLLNRVQEDPPPLLHRRLRAWERGHPSLPGDPGPPRPPPATVDAYPPLGPPPFEPLG